MVRSDQVVRRFLAAANPVLEKLRKGKGQAAIQVTQLIGVLEDLAFRVESEVVWVKSPYHERAPIEQRAFIEADEQRSLPPHPKKGQRAYLNVRIQGNEVLFEQWEAEPGYRLTSPDGASLDLAVEGNRPTPALWKWLKAQPSYMAAMTGGAAAPAPAPAPSRGPSPQRTLENTGTCPCCFKNQKLKGGGMVLHGYRAPGLGAGFQGNCFGVGYPPFEVSAEGTKAYKGVILAEAHKADAVVGAVRRGDVDELPDPIRYGKKVQKATASPASWADAIEKALPGLQHQADVVKAEVERLDRLIRGWKPG